MVQIVDTSRKSNLARRLYQRRKAIAAGRRKLTDREIEHLIRIIGVERTWQAFEALTSPQSAAAR